MSTPLAYLALPELSQVLLPTLAAACFRDSRLCQLVEAQLSLAPVARMLQGAAATAATAGAGAATAAATAGGVSTGTITDDADVRGPGAASDAAPAQSVQGMALGCSGRQAAAVAGAAALAQAWGAGPSEDWGQGRYALSPRLPGAMLQEMYTFFAARACC